MDSWLLFMKNGVRELRGVMGQMVTFVGGIGFFFSWLFYFAYLTLRTKGKVVKVIPLILSTNPSQIFTLSATCAAP